MKSLLEYLRANGENAVAAKVQQGAKAGADEARGRDPRKGKKAKARKKARKGRRASFWKHYFVVWAEYPIRGSMGIHGDSDRLLHKAVGMASSGSGSGFGWRDMDWLFKTRAKALSVAKRLRRLRSKIKGLRVRVSEAKEGGHYEHVWGDRVKKLKKPRGKKVNASAKGAAKLGAKATKKFVLMYNMSGNYTRHKMKFVKSKKTGEIARFATFAQAWMVAKSVSAKDKAPYFYVTTPTSGVVAVLRRGKGKKVKS